MFNIIAYFKQKMEVLFPLLWSYFTPELHSGVKFTNIKVFVVNINLFSVTPQEVLDICLRWRKKHYVEDLRDIQTVLLLPSCKIGATIYSGMSNSPIHHIFFKMFTNWAGFNKDMPE